MDLLDRAGDRKRRGLRSRAVLSRNGSPWRSCITSTATATGCFARRAAQTPDASTPCLSALRGVGATKTSLASAESSRIPAASCARVRQPHEPTNPNAVLAPEAASPIRAVDLRLPAGARHDRNRCGPTAATAIRRRIRRARRTPPALVDDWLARLNNTTGQQAGARGLLRRDSRRLLEDDVRRRHARPDDDAVDRRDGAKLAGLQDALALIERVESISGQIPGASGDRPVPHPTSA